MTLILIRDAVTFHSGSEATLRTEGEPFEWDIVRSFLDALSKFGGGFQSGLLGRYEAEYHNAIFRYVP